jgi:hypothetical protein
VKIDLTPEYQKVFYDLILEAHLLGVSVSGEQSQTFDDLLFGDFEVSTRTIHIYFPEGNRTITSREIHTLAHELQHVRQFLSKRFPDFFLWLAGCGSKPEQNTVDLLEAEADLAAKLFLKLHGIKPPR